jgi:hypothetical protein
MPRRCDLIVVIDKGACPCGGDIVRRRIGVKKTQCETCEVKARNLRARDIQRRRARAKKVTENITP